MKLRAIMLAISLAETATSCQSEEERQADEPREQLHKVVDQIEETNAEQIAILRETTVGVI